MPKLIFCFTDDRYLEVAQKIGFITGNRQHSLSKDTLKYCHFYDNDFKHKDYEGFIYDVQTYHPEIIVAPDLENQKDVDFANSLFDLFPHTTIYVCPKFDCINQLSKEIVLAYPNHNNFSDKHSNLSWFKHRQIHVLGGTPPVQRQIAQKYNVISVDSNSFTKVAMIAHKIFIPHFPWWKKIQKMSLIELITTSLQNIKFFWEISIKNRSLI